MSIILRKTITETFLERARTTPKKVAFKYKVQNTWKEITFAAHFEEVKRVAAGLNNLGVQPGDKVALLSNTRYEWSLCDMSILGAKAVTVPIYASNTAEDVAYITNHSEAKVIFVEDAKQLQKLLQKRAQDPQALPHLKNIVSIDPSAISITLDDPAKSKDVLTLHALIELGRREEARDPARVEQNLASALPSDLFTICYTSGTTGIPKGALLTHDNLMSVLEDSAAVIKKFLSPDDDSILSFLPFSHILARVESMTPYVFGWRQNYAENIESLMLNLSETSPTVIFCVPRIFEKAYGKILSAVDEMPKLQHAIFESALSVGRRYHGAIWAGKRPSFVDAAEYAVAKNFVFSKIAKRFGGKLRFAVSGGAPLPKEIGEFFQILGIDVIEGYGLTETCAPVTLNTPDHVKFGTVGRPLPEVNLKIADDGEILVHSRKIFNGYYKNPEDTASVLEEGWFHTGDIGQIDSEGFLQITDRKKDLIVTSGGKKVAPQKLENLAKIHKIIGQFVVYGDRKNFITALISLDHEEVIRYASQNQILFSAYPELIKNPKIISLVQKVIDEVNKDLASFETIKKFVIVPNEFTVESGELTPSLKVKRAVVSKRYRAELDHLYTESAPNA